MKCRLLTVGIVLISVLFIDSMHANIIRVGPLQQYKTPSEVVQIAQDGDTIAIDAGVYERDVAAWRQNNLHFIGMNGMAHMKSLGRASQGKAIWVIKGRDVTIENIEFSGCKVPDKNGAGIRMEGQNLTIYHCYFHDNENGILTGHNVNSTLKVSRSEFGYNGYGDGYSHNIYVGNLGTFIAKSNYFHHAKIGHQIKSRANENYILYNRVMDEMTGNSSRLIDLPNGGYALVMGNLLMQGPNAENNNMLGYGLEGLKNTPPHELVCYNNTMVNERRTVTFIQVKEGSNGRIINNVFVGKGTLLNGSVDEMHHNVMENDPVVLKFEDYDNYDYYLQYNSPLVDAGTSRLLLPNNILLDRQYRHPASFGERVMQDSMDIGAHEYMITTSVQQALNDETSIYPNPGTDFIHIQSSDDIQLKGIFDFQGQSMQPQWREDGVLDISGYPSGNYILYFQKGDTFFNRLFIKS